jgi:signal transduction histidine kinase
MDTREKMEELVIDNKELAEELMITHQELASQIVENEKQATELLIANKELAFQNEEKAKRADELLIANKELAFQNEEKAKRAAELIIAEKELAFQAELAIANKELAFQYKEKAKRADELIITNNELNQLLQLNADKNRFISILAHDLRSPFNNLLGLSELLIEDIRKLNTDEIEDIVNNINASAKSSFNLLENILSWTKAQQGKIPFDPQLLSFIDNCKDVIEVLNPIAKAKNITINYSATDYLNVFADADMLKTILRNLVSNAIKFTNIGGAIKINAVQNSENVTISVSDNGIGIPPENLAKLFNISEVLTTKGTTGETGTGLGLLLCKEFVEKHGGRIWVESEVRNGSDFKFALPIFAEQENGIDN